MTAFTYRMGAGFPGDVNRTHPASIEPCLIDKNAPPTAYGQPVLVDATTQGVRPFTTTDTAVTAAYGVTVRSFPSQQATTAANYGAIGYGNGAPPLTGKTDALRSGYIMSALGGSAAAVKGGAVYVWCAATSGAHIQGGFEAAASSGNTAALAGATFNGPADAAGVVEIAFNI